jgi:hypothetical protein
VASLGRYRRQNTAGIRRRQRSAYAHFVQVVRKLLSAFEAHHVGLPLRDACFTHRRHGPGEAGVGTAEEKIQDSVDHSPEPKLRGEQIRDPIACVTQRLFVVSHKRLVPIQPD